MENIKFITGKEDYKVDVAVLLVFFNRPNTLSKVFERLKEVRPSKLYLCQDSAREGNPNDKENTEKCREIVSDITWNCELHQKYSDVNLGCDANIYSALNWIFESEEFIIMLEDDAVVDATFFPFCKQMCDKYKNDTRISLVSSFNLLEKWDCPYDYFFSKSGTMSGGWGMWKRAWNERDKDFSVCTDEYSKKIFKKSEYIKADIKSFLNCSEVNKNLVSNGKNIYFFESIVGSSRFLNSSLAIVPSKNMMTNVGLDPNSYHYGSNIKQLPRAIQKIMFMKSYPMPQEIKHPKFILADSLYYKKIFKIIGSNPLVIFKRKVESRIRRIIYK